MGSGGAAATEESKGEESAHQAAMKLVGFKNFVRHNPRSDKFGVHRFHHVEFWVGDATNAYKRCVFCVVVVVCGARTRHAAAFAFLG